MNTNGNGFHAQEAVAVVAAERFEVIKSLTQNERVTAHQKALKIMQKKAGTEPDRRQFERTTVSKYPQWITGTVVGISVVVLLTAFIVSAMRLYHIGEATFFESLPDRRSAQVAGWAIVFMSEATAVLFTIALSVIGQSRTQKIILMASIVGSAALALSGNYYVALHDHSVTVFSVFEAMFPPLFTLATAYVLKELMLERIQARHADQQAYELAMVEWEAASADPEHHPDFEQAYANELRDAIVRKNRSEAAQDAMRGFTSVDWTALVKREMSTEDWFEGGATAVRLPLA